MSALDDFAVPVCIFCKKGTRPRRLVTAIYNFPARRTYFGHWACVDKNNDRPIPRDPPRNHTYPIPTPEERLAQWNRLASEFSALWAEIWRPGELRANATIHAVVRAWNDARERARYMRDALVDPRYRDHPGTHVRALRWFINRLRAIFERDHLARRRWPSKGAPARLYGVFLAPTLQQLRRSVDEDDWNFMWLPIREDAACPSP